MTIRFSVPGRPEGKRRPRFKRVGNFVRTHADPGDVSYEAKVATFAREAMRGALPFARGVPLCLFVTARFLPPQSMSGKRSRECLAGLRFPTGRPDTDNIVKMIKDALNAVVWHDDSAVVHVEASKLYGERDEVCVEVMEAQALRRACDDLADAERVAA